MQILNYSVNGWSEIGQTVNSAELREIRTDYIFVKISLRISRYLDWFKFYLPLFALIKFVLCLQIILNILRVDSFTFNYAIFYC